MNISAPFLAYLVDFASIRGIAPHTLKQLLTNPEIDCNAEESQVSAEEYLKVLQQLVATQNDDYLGLAYGAYLNLGALGLIYKISLGASSIEQAFKLLEDYLSVNFPLIQIEKYMLSNHIHIELKARVADKVLSRHLLDSTCAIIYRELCMMMNAESVAMTLPYKEVSMYEQRLKAHISQGETYSFTFDVQQVNQEINQKNLQLIEVLLPKYLAMLDTKQEEKLFSGQVKQMILHMCSPGLPDFGQVSAQFAVSNRTFQRKLTKEGQSFRSITNNIKRELASYLREGNQVKTQDIAYILGYSEASAYLHAAKEWFG